MGREKLVIVGGGVAGLGLASALGRQGKASKQIAPDITVLDRDSAHVWKPMLHTIAAGTSDISQQQTTYIAQARDCGFTYQPGELAGIERNLKKVLVKELRAPDGRLLLPERSIAYDTLVVAVGSQAKDRSEERRDGTDGVRMG